MTRIILPVRRHSESARFEFWDQGFHYTTGRAQIFGSIREVFLNVGKTGEHFQILARDSAIVLSIALQHRATLSEIGRALTRDPDGAPAGPIGKLVDELIEDEARRKADLESE